MSVIVPDLKFEKCACCGGIAKKCDFKRQVEEKGERKKRSEALAEMEKKNHQTPQSGIGPGTW